MVTCSPSLKGRGFSVHPRRHPSESPKGLPGPLNVSGRVLVAVQDQPAGGTDMGTYAQALTNERPTPATLLAGVGRVHRDHPTASVCCFAFEDGAELCPPGITDALG